MIYDNDADVIVENEERWDFYEEAWVPGGLGRIPIDDLFGIEDSTRITEFEPEFKLSADNFDRFIENWPKFRRDYPDMTEVGVRTFYDLYYIEGSEQAEDLMQYLAYHSYNKDVKGGHVTYVSVKDVDAYHARLTIPQYRKEFKLASPGIQMVEVFRRRGLTLKISTKIVELGYTISGMKNVEYRQLVRDFDEKDVKRICKAFDIDIPRSEIPEYTEEFVLHSPINKFISDEIRDFVLHAPDEKTMHDILRAVRDAWIDTWHGIYGRLDRTMPEFVIHGPILRQNYWVEVKGYDNVESELGMLESMIHGHAGLLAKDRGVVESAGRFKSSRGTETFRFNSLFRNRYGIRMLIDYVSPTASCLTDLYEYWLALSRLVRKNRDTILEYAPEFKLNADTVSTDWFEGYFFYPRWSPNQNRKEDFFYFAPLEYKDDVYEIVGKGIIKAWIHLDYTGRNDMSHTLTGRVYRDNYNTEPILRFKPDEKRT